jgi:cell wall-associated NlpC family hydrolase
MHPSSNPVGHEVTSATIFSTPDRLAALDRAARSWLGTPFAPHAMVKGAGADCVHLVAGIYIELGVLKSFAAGPYTLDEGTHLKHSKIETWFASHPEFIRGSGRESAAIPGDTLLFNLARVGHHVGLLLAGGDFIHVYAERGRSVIISNLRESFYARRIAAVYRPINSVGAEVTRRRGGA